MFLAVAALILSTPVQAHVVPKGTFDRTITVCVRPGEADRGNIVVEYRLEVDELTLVLEELSKLKKLDIDLNPLDYRGEELQFYTQFMRHYGPLLASNLEASINNQPLLFDCTKQVVRLHDDQGEALGHVRCDFTFQAEFSAATQQRCTLRFREGNYEDKRGKIHVSVAGMSLPRVAAAAAANFLSPAGPYEALELIAISALSPGVLLLDTTEPGAAQRSLADIERAPDADEKLRQFGATFELVSATAEPVIAVVPAPPTTRKVADHSPADHDHGLLRLLLQSDYSIVVLLLIFAGIGAVHALTPGHGKTLVAAYLVGQRGTIGHAFILGLVTTLTHTGVVMIFAAALNFVPAEALFQVQAGLGLAMGLAICCLGFWLLLKRLSGGADHIHIGSAPHHHHGPHGHTHHHHHQPTSGAEVTWWNLIVLGMTGGIIPCWDAVAILGFCVGRGQMWLALPLVLAFSAGLAGVLVLIGILVVKVRSFASSKWGEGRLSRSLPIISAIVIMALGLWLCRMSIAGSA